MKKVSFAVFGISGASLPQGTTGKSYKGSITVTGIKASDWELSGDLPDGLKFSNGKISGKPTQCGSFDFTVKVSAGEFFVSENYRIKIYPADPVFKTKSLTKGKIHEPFNRQVELKTNGGAIITWSADFPDKLENLEINSQTGEISGTPRHVFKGKIPVTATNDYDHSTTQYISLQITADKPKILTTSLPAATAEAEYSATLEASGSPNFTWSGNLP